MIDLRRKYEGLLEVMREGFTQKDGSQLTWKSPEFVDRIEALVKQFVVHGVPDPDEDDFDMILGKEWDREHYEKVLNKFFELGAINEYDLPLVEECETVGLEVKMIQEDRFYV